MGVALRYAQDKNKFAFNRPGFGTETRLIGQLSVPSFLGQLESKRCEIVASRVLSLFSKSATAMRLLRTLCQEASPLIDCIALENAEFANCRLLPPPTPICTSMIL